MTAEQFLAVRHKLGFTQEVLAKRLRVDVQTVARYEKGETPVRGPVEVLMEVMLVVYRDPPLQSREAMAQLSAICGIEPIR